MVTRTRIVLHGEVLQDHGQKLGSAADDLARTGSRLSAANPTSSLGLLAGGVLGGAVATMCAQSAKTLAASTDLLRQMAKATTSVIDTFTTIESEAAAKLDAIDPSLGEGNHP